jgi:hypothetical protein
VFVDGSKRYERAPAQSGALRRAGTAIVAAALIAIGYGLSNVRLVLEAFNIFDARVSDIDYYYTSRLPGEPAAGVQDIHTHPASPRSARLGLQFSF